MEGARSLVVDVERLLVALVEEQGRTIWEVDGFGVE